MTRIAQPPAFGRVFINPENPSELWCNIGFVFPVFGQGFCPSVPPQLQAKGVTQVHWDELKAKIQVLFQKNFFSNFDGWKFFAMMLLVLSVVTTITITAVMGADSLADKITDAMKEDVPPSSYQVPPITLPMILVRMGFTGGTLVFVAAAGYFLIRCTTAKIQEPWKEELQGICDDLNPWEPWNGSLSRHLSNEHPQPGFVMDVQNQPRYGWPLPGFSIVFDLKKMTSAPTPPIYQAVVTDSNIGAMLDGSNGLTSIFPQAEHGAWPSMDGGSRRPLFCTHCGSPAGTGTFCANCGQLLAAE